MKRLSIPALALLALAAGSARATVAPAVAGPQAAGGAGAQSPEDQVRALEEEYDAAQQALSKKLKELETDEARREYAAANRPDPKTFAERFQALADAHRGTEAAARALAWIVTRAQSETLARPAIERLAAEHASSPHLARVCGRLEGIQGEWAKKTLEKLVETSPNAEIRGRSLYALARRAMAGGELGSKNLLAEAETLLERVVKEYGDVSVGKRTLGQSAQGDLFEMRNLAIGKIAPDIEGEDIGGTKFKLSDYRGKVVVLDFWGNW